MAGRARRRDPGARRDPALTPGVRAGLAGGAGAPGPSDPALRAELEAIARRRTYFGHQSVGGDILDGMRRLAARERVELRVVESGTAAAVPAATLGHGLLGENGRPELKIEGFARALEAGESVDVALMKLCYVDFDGATDPAALFARYRATLRDLRQRHPRTTFVHVTVPLTATQPWPKAFLKRLLGRESAEARNARREQYNALVREAYAGREPIFDLARIESTHPDGRVETASWSGRAVPALVPGYTYDGGHLNEAGRERVARELAAVLAALPGSSVAGTREAR